MCNITLTRSYVLHHLIKLTTVTYFFCAFIALHGNAIFLFFTISFILSLLANLMRNSPLEYLHSLSLYYWIIQIFSILCCFKGKIIFTIFVHNFFTNFFMTICYAYFFTLFISLEKEKKFKLHYSFVYKTILAFYKNVSPCSFKFKLFYYRKLSTCLTL